MNEYGELGPRLPRRRYRGPILVFIEFDTADVMAFGRSRRHNKLRNGCLPRRTDLRLMVEKVSAMT